MKTFLLICDVEEMTAVELTDKLLALPDIGDIYSFGEAVHFVRSTLSDEELAREVRALTSTRSQFLVKEFDGRSFGNLVPSLWDFLRSADAQLPSAAA